MSRRRETSPVRKFFQSRLFLVVLLVVSILVALNFARAYYQDINIRNEIERLENEVGQLEQRKIESLAILEYVTSDAFVEEKARTELNLRKPGEHVAVISQDESTMIQTQVEPESVRHLANPTRWWHYFTHKDMYAE